MSRFSSFKVTSEVYKTINGHDIPADLYIPNDLRPGQHPLIIRIHGGGLITGARGFEDWFHVGIIDYALAQSAIMVSPDHRLLPESKGIDILDDMEDLWTWIHRDLPSIVATSSPGSQVDLERVMVTGESAGGYLAIQLALSHSNGIRAVVAAYPMLDLKESPFWPTHYEKLFSSNPRPILPVSIIDEHLAAMKPGEIVTEDLGFTRRDFARATVQHGRLIEMLGEEPKLFPEERIQLGEVLPPIFLFHGIDDALIPVEASEKFVEIVKKKGFDVHFVKMPGEHGFASATRLSEGWMKEGMDFITGALMK